MTLAVYSFFGAFENSWYSGGSRYYFNSDTGSDRIYTGPEVYCRVECPLVRLRDKKQEVFMERHEIDELIKELTLEEKIGMIHGQGIFHTGGVTRFDIPRSGCPMGQWE